MQVQFALDFVRDREDGQTLVEYGLILLLVSIVSIAILTTIGGRISSLFVEINTAI